MIISFSQFIDHFPMRTPLLENYQLPWLVTPEGTTHPSDWCMSNPSQLVVGPNHLGQPVIWIACQSTCLSYSATAHSRKPPGNHL